MLFEEGPGTADHSRKPNESLFEWFNDRSRVEAVRGRQVINAWLMNLEANKRVRIAELMRTGIDRQFKDALFELYAGGGEIPALHVSAGQLNHPLSAVEWSQACGFRAVVRHSDT
jgi:hypothetical protein